MNFITPLVFGELVSAVVSFPFGFGCLLLCFLSSSKEFYEDSYVIEVHTILNYSSELTQVFSE